VSGLAITQIGNLGQYVLMMVLSSAPELKLLPKMLPKMVRSGFLFVVRLPTFFCTGIQKMTGMQFNCTKSGMFCTC
jgi:hypothetical protein